jgi:hypothetical protein
MFDLTDFAIRTLEGQVLSEKVVEDHSDAPNIAFLIVVGALFRGLRGLEAWCTRVAKDL